MEGDVEKAISFLKDVRHKCEDVTSHINNIVNKVENGDLNTSKVILEI
jgi:hypothetical protein